MARPTLVQAPNTELIVALTAKLLTYITSGWARGLSQAVFYGAIMVWAHLEITKGANTFRRALGTAVLLIVLAGLTRRLA